MFNLRRGPFSSTLLIKLAVLLPAVLMLSACLTTSSSDSGGSSDISMKNINFTPAEIDPGMVETMEFSKGEREYFNQGRSKALARYRETGSTAALETLFEIQRFSLYHPTASYEAAWDLYRINPEQYKKLFSEAAFVRAMVTDNWEGSEILTMRGEAALYAYRLSPGRKRAESLLTAIGGHPETMAYAFILAMEADMADKAEIYLTGAVEHTPVYLSSLLRREGFESAAVKVDSLIEASPGVNDFELYFADDFNDNSQLWYETDSNGIFSSVEDGAYHIANNRSPKGNYVSFHYSIRRKFEGWSYLRFDYTDTSATPEDGEYWLYLGNVILHVDGEKGYRILGNYSPIYHDFLVLKGWEPLPADCQPGHTFNIGIYPGDDEVLFQLGTTMIPLAGAQGRREPIPYFDLMPGSSGTIDNVRFFRMAAPGLSMAALPEQIYSDFDKNIANASEEDIRRWLSDPYMRAYYFEEMVIRVTGEAFDWDRYLGEAAANLDLFLFELLEASEPAITARGLEAPGLEDQEIFRIFHDLLDQKIVEWSSDEDKEAIRQYLDKAYYEYRFSNRWDSVLTDGLYLYSSSFGQLRKLRNQQAGRNYDELSSNYRKYFPPFLDTLLNLGATDIETTWLELKAEGRTEEMTEYATGLFRTPEDRSGSPFSSRGKPYYWEYFGENSEWSTHDMANSEDYLCRLTDRYPSQGYLLANADNGDNSYNYFYTRKDIPPVRSFLAGDNNTSLGNLLDITVNMVNSDEYRRPDTGQKFVLEYNGFQLVIRDNREFQLYYDRPFTDNSWTLIQDWTAIEGGFFYESNVRLRASIYTGEDGVVLVLNDSQHFAFPEMPPRKVGNSSVNYGDQITFYVYEGSAFLLTELTARDAYMIRDQWMDEMQWEAFTSYLNQETSDRKALYSLLSENFYRNRSLYEQMKNRLLPYRDEAVGHLINMGEWRVLENMYIDDPAAFMRDSGEYIRIQLNDVLNDENRSLKYFFNSIYPAYKSGHIFYNVLDADDESITYVTGIRFDSNTEERVALIKEAIRDADGDEVSFPWINDEYFMMNLCGLAEPE